MDVVKEDMKVVGVREEDAEDRETTDSLWRPLKGKAERRIRRSMYIHV